MLSFKNIVHATDFSPAAHAALHVACALARDYGAPLTVVHVRPVAETITGEFGTLPMEPRESVEALRKRMREIVPAEFKDVEFEVRDGDAATEIVASLKTRPNAVLVLGTHGRSALGRLLLGSVAETILRDAPCPVLTVRAPMPAAAPRQPEAEADVDAAELATVCSVASPVEAEVIRLALQDQGIRAFVEGEMQAGIVGTMGIPVRIMVAADQAERAGKIVRKSEAHRHFKPT
jgi:nucleotide-binding universal stress UspA family protein